MNTYQTFDSMWRNSRRRKLDNNTYLEQSGEDYAIRLHSTNVVTHHTDGSVTLNSGGWRTVTTKDRMNKFQSLARVYSERGVWIVSANGREANFADGVTITADGVISGADMSTDYKALQARAKRYTDSYIKALDSGKVPAPSNGDCWYCSMRTDTGKPLVEVTSGCDHVMSHIEEGYYVPSLLARAIERFPVAPVAKWYLSDRWAGTNNCGDNGIREAAVRQLRSSLRRYVRSQINLAS
jgi:hypothetical protein